MFHPKTEIVAEDVARRFILRTANAADKTFTELCDSVLQVLMRNGLLHEGVTALYENKDLKRLYFSALLAVGIVELGRAKQGFAVCDVYGHAGASAAKPYLGSFHAQTSRGLLVDRRTVTAVADATLARLSVRGGLGEASAGDVVLDYLRRADALKHEMRPHEAVALRMLGHLGLPDGDRAARVLRNPLSATPLTSLLAAVAAGSWTGLDEGRKIAA